MASSLIGPNASRWQTLRKIVSAADTPKTVYQASDFDATLRSKGEGCNGMSRMIVRAYGTDAASETATLTLSGWMGDSDKTDHGPGIILWKGELTTGTITWAETGRTYDLADKGFPGTTTWFEVSDWNTGVAGGGNLSQSTELADNSMSVLLLNTLGCTRIVAEVSAIAGGNPQMSSIALIWRPASMEGV